jgi:protein gp37
MAENSSIEWTDHTFNPWMGCTKVSPGCDHCYAEARMDTRLHRVSWGPGQPRQRTKTWGDPVRWNKAHDAFYAAHGRRQRVFCASLADVFDNEVPTQWRRTCSP